MCGLSYFVDISSHAFTPVHLLKKTMRYWPLVSHMKVNKYVEAFQKSLSYTLHDTQILQIIKVWTVKDLKRWRDMWLKRTHLKGRKVTQLRATSHERYTSPRQQPDSARQKRNQKEFFYSDLYLYLEEKSKSTTDNFSKEKNEMFMAGVKVLVTWLLITQNIVTSLINLYIDQVSFIIYSLLYLWNTVKFYNWKCWAFLPFFFLEKTYVNLSNSPVSVTGLGPISNTQNQILLYSYLIWKNTLTSLHYLFYKD